MKLPSPNDLLALRDQGSELLGRKLLINGIRLPKTDIANEVLLETRNKVNAVISQVEVFPWLQDGTTYAERFKQGIRAPGRTFTFQTFGAPLVAQTLKGQPTAIAVIKRLLGSDGKDHSWAEILQCIGAHPSQFKDFVELADNLDIRHPNAPIQFQAIDGVDSELEHDTKLKFDLNVRNLDSVISLTRGSRKQLRDVIGKNGILSHR
jgi:hypothetical protein